ncbi:MAG: hypothetical protein RR533_04550 [Carnobacterium sp.]
MRIELWNTYGYVIHEGPDKIILWQSNNKYKFENKTTGRTSKEYRVLFGLFTEFKPKWYSNYVSKKITRRINKFLKEEDSK